MDDREQTLTKGTRAACGHLVAKGRKVFDGECFACAADRRVRTLKGQRPAFWVVAGGASTPGWSSATSTAHWRFGRA